MSECIVIPQWFAGLIGFAMFAVGVYGERFLIKNNPPLNMASMSICITSAVAFVVGFILFLIYGIIPVVTLLPCVKVV